MHLTIDYVHEQLFQDRHYVHVRAMIFRLRALCHRLQQFGFENFINEYEPRELVMASALLQQVQHDALLKEAHRRGDDKLKAWIERHIPWYFQKATA